MLIRNAINSALKKAEKYLQTDTRYLAKGGFWVMVSRILFILSGFVLTLGFANLLPQQEYGVYRFILSLGAIAGVFSLTGMGTTVIRAAAKDIPGTLTWAVLTRLKWSIGTFIIALLLATYYVFNENYTIATGLLIVGSFTPFIDSFKLYNSFLIGKKEFRKSTLYGLSRRTVPIIAMLVALYATNNILILLAVFFATNALSLFSVFITIRRQYPENGSLDHETLNYSKHLSLMNIFTDIVGQMDKILIFHFLGAAPLAIYAFAQIPVTQLQGLVRAVRSLLIPKVATRDLSELKLTLPRKSLIFASAVIPIAIGYIFCAPLLYNTIFPQYTESILLSQVLALTLFFVPISTLLSQTLIAHMKKREVWILQVVLPMIKISLLALMLPLYGLWGVVFAVLVERIISVFLTYLLFIRA